MSDVKMSDVEVADYPEWRLCDFLPKEMAIINRSGLPEPTILEIVKRSNWLNVVDVHGDDRDAKLVLKALTSYDSNQELIAKQAEQIELLRETLKRFIPLDEDGNGMFMYNEGSECDGEAVIKALAATKE